MTLIVFCFGNHAMERHASTHTQDLRWDDIEGHLLEQLLKPIHAIHAITFQSTLKRAVAGTLTGAVLSELAHPNGFGLH